MIKAKVFYSDGRELEAKIGPRAKVEVERRFDVMFSDIMVEAEGGEDGKMKPRRLEMCYYAAHQAVLLAGLETEADYDAWLLLIDDMTFESDDAGQDSENPTQRAATPESS